MQNIVVAPNTGKILIAIPNEITIESFLGLNPCLSKLETVLIIFIFQFFNFLQFVFIILNLFITYMVELKIMTVLEGHRELKIDLELEIVTGLLLPEEMGFKLG